MVTYRHIRDDAQRRGNLPFRVMVAARTYGGAVDHGLRIYGGDLKIKVYVYAAELQFFKLCIYGGDLVLRLPCRF